MWITFAPHIERTSKLKPDWPAPPQKKKAGTYLVEFESNVNHKEKSLYQDVLEGVTKIAHYLLLLIYLDLFLSLLMLK